MALSDYLTGKNAFEDSDDLAEPPVSENGIFHSPVLPDRSAAAAMPAVKTDAQMPTVIFFTNIGLISPVLFLGFSSVSLSFELNLVNWEQH